MARRFSMPFRPPSALPFDSSWPTIRESLSSPHFDGSPMSMPKPVRKPWLRNTPTVGCDTLMLSRPIFALEVSPIVLAAHAPISSPARKLSVANVMSAESIGSSGVSSASTTRPASRAIFTEEVIALVSEATRRIPPAPAATQVSIAATCVS